MLFLQHYSPTFFLFSSFLSPKRVIKHSFGYKKRNCDICLCPFCFPLCFWGVRCGLQGMYDKNHYLHKTGKSLRSKPGRFLAFTLKIVEDVTVQPCVSGLGLKSHFFSPRKLFQGREWGWEQRVRGVCWHDWGLCTWCLHCLNFDLLFNLMMCLVLDHDAHLLLCSDLWTQELAEK